MTKRIPTAQQLTDPLRVRHNREPAWTGGVVRNDPRDYQKAGQHETWWCRGEGCGGFTPRGSFEAKECLRCGTPRPANA